MNRAYATFSIALTLLLATSLAAWAGTEIMTIPANAKAPATTQPPVYEQGDQLFYGRIHAMPDTGLTGRWTIAGRAIEVTDSTVLDDKGFPFQPGAEVRVLCETVKKRLQAKSIAIRR